MTAKPREAWERMPDETDKAFAAFERYRELGAERSMAAILEASGLSAGSRRHVETWASKYRWTARASAWDDHKAELAREAELAGDAEVRRHALDLSRRALVRILERSLAALDAVDISEASFADLARSATAAAKALRDWYDPAESVVEVDLREVTERTVERIREARALRVRRLTARAGVEPDDDDDGEGDA